MISTKRKTNPALVERKRDLSFGLPGGSFTNAAALATLCTFSSVLLFKVRNLRNIRSICITLVIPWFEGRRKTYACLSINLAVIIITYNVRIFTVLGLSLMFKLMRLRLFQRASWTTTDARATSPKGYVSGIADSISIGIARVESCVSYMGWIGRYLCRYLLRRLPTSQQRRQQLGLQKWSIAH